MGHRRQQSAGRRLLRFLERATPQVSERWDKATGPDAGAASNGETLPLEPPRIRDDASGLELHPGSERRIDKLLDERARSEN